MFVCYDKHFKPSICSPLRQRWWGLDRLDDVLKVVGPAVQIDVAWHDAQDAHHHDACLLPAGTCMSSRKGHTVTTHALLRLRLAGSPHTMQHLADSRCAWETSSHRVPHSGSGASSSSKCIRSTLNFSLIWTQ